MGKNRFLLIFLVISALSLRIIASYLPPFWIDTNGWYAWSDRLFQLGFSQFYSTEVWTNYTPGYLYILYVLGFISNALNLNHSLIQFLHKLPAIFADIAMGILVYKIISQKYSQRSAYLASSLILFNPAFIFNSSVWGQIDSVLIFFLILTIYFLSKKNYILSAICLGWSFLIKPQTVAFGPLLILFLLKDFHWKKIYQLFIPAITTIILLSLPFFITSPLTGIFQMVANMSQDYKVNSLFAYNFWGIMGFWIPDNQKFLFFTLQQWGLVMFAIFWGIICLLMVRKKLNLYSLAALSFLAFFFLPTRVHERYLLPSLPFLLLTTAFLRSYKLYYLYLLLSSLHLLNLYYVYVYYNELYLNREKILYNPILYNFLDKNTYLLSIISTLAFVSITILISTQKTPLSQKQDN